MSDDLELLRTMAGPHNADGVLRSDDHHAARAVIARLGETKHAAAIPLLVAIASDPTPYARNRDDVLAALKTIGGARVAEAILGRLLEVVDRAAIPWDAMHPTMFVVPMIDAAVAADEIDPFERLGPLFVPERVRTPAGASVARDALIWVSGKLHASAHAVVALLQPDRAPGVRIGDDPRWQDRVVRLLGDRRLRLHAKGLLSKLTPIDVQVAYERVAGPDAMKRPKTPVPPDAAALAQAEKEAEAIAAEIRAALERAQTRLKGSKYSPRAGNKALPPLDVAGNDVRLSELEKLIKAPLPAMVRALYRVVGPFDFQRPLDKTPPPELEGFASAPRLQVVPLERATKSVKARIRDNAGIPHPLRSPLALELSDDTAVLLEPWCTDPKMEDGEETLSEHLLERIAAWGLG